MRVYAESNFVLEVVLEQEQHASCEDLIRLAEEGRIELNIPAFSLFEPFTTLHRRQRARNELHERLQRELNLIGRTKAFSNEVSTTTLPALLVRSAQQASLQFGAVQDRLLSVARIIPLAADVFVAAREAEAAYGLEMPDALVFASVIRDLNARPAESCFLNRNTKDFDDPTIVALLAAQNCRMLGSFHAGASFITAKLGAY